MKTVLTVFVGVFLSGFICFYQWQKWTQVRLIFCDVGQGDAILITSGHDQMLVDSGPDDQVLTCLHHHLPWWDKQIEWLVLSHAHLDHYGGLPAVLQHYQIKKAVLPPDIVAPEPIKMLWQALIKAQTGSQLKLSFQPYIGQELALNSSIKARVFFDPELQPLPQAKNTRFSSLTEATLSATLSPWSQSNSSINNRSIGLIVGIHGVGVLLTGDMEKTAEQAVLNAGMIDKTMILKAGHHGSNSSSTPSFLERVQPELTVISVGEGNHYGHPHPEAISRLVAGSGQVMRTDETGEIVILINGNQYRVLIPIGKRFSNWLRDFFVK